MKKGFLKILQNSQKNTYAGVSFSFAYSSVYISEISVADFEHVFFAGKGREKQLLLFESFKYLTQQTKTYSKLATVTLKQDVKFVKS